MTSVAGPSFHPDAILADYVRSAFVQQVTSLGDLAVKRLLATFANIADEANAVADETFRRLGAQPGEGDMGDVAEEAQDAGIDHYHTLSMLEQAVKNLLAAGLYHVFEQQQKVFEELTRRRLGGIIDLSAFPSWGKVDELRLVTNTVKHAEGSSARQLRARRPELFVSPLLAETGIRPRPEPVKQPLAGEDLYVREEDLEDYSAALVSLWEEVATAVS